METEIKEEKIVVLKRVAPGDRWKSESSPFIFESLTEALEGYYQKTGDTKFYIDAREGTVSIVKTEAVTKPIKRFSLYGEE